MPQIFPPVANAIARLVVFGGLLAVAAAVAAFGVVRGSSFVRGSGVPVEQPVPFSHEHHVGGLGIDCRYCHTTVENSAFAGMPDTYTCMSCHSQIWTDSPTLAPVRASLATGTPLRWNRVYRLPDFVYFDHGIHVSRGVGCASCHGRIDRMPLTWAASTLEMRWCLDCHRHPERALRPRDAVFDLAWTPPADQEARGRALAAAAHLDTRRLTSCSTCHR